jgi:hypothetical protein
MEKPLLRKFVRSVLAEGLADVVAAAARIRVDVLSPNSPTYNDILTGIRGIVNVITVRTEGHLTKAGGKKQIANIVIRYEAKSSFGPGQLEAQLMSVNGIDLARVKSVDGVPWKQKKTGGESPDNSTDNSGDSGGAPQKPKAKKKQKPVPPPTPMLKMPG